MNQLEEERDTRVIQTTHSAVLQKVYFYPYRTHYQLPPPVQTSKRNENNSKNREPFENSWESTRKLDTVERGKSKDEMVTPTQGEPREFGEHSREWLDPMMSIRNLHTQQRQNQRSVQELNQNSPPAPQTPQINVSQQEPNLITFTPLVEQQIPQMQGTAGRQEQPKRQRSPRKKKRSEWTLNQRQFDQNKSQEISHISPREHLNVFNGEEQSVSYLQLPVKKKEDNHFCTRCGETGHWTHYCQVATWCKILHIRHTCHTSLPKVRDICKRQPHSIK